MALERSLVVRIGLSGSEYQFAGRENLSPTFEAGGLEYTPPWFLPKRSHLSYSNELDALTLASFSVLQHWILMSIHKTNKIIGSSPTVDMSYQT